MKADNGFNIGELIREQVRAEQAARLDADLSYCLEKYFDLYVPGFWDIDS